MRNSLSASYVSANDVNEFKDRLDTFWTNQELMYDYKSSLTGVDNTSSVDNFDDNIFFSFITMLCTEASACGVFSFALLCFLALLLNRISL